MNKQELYVSSIELAIRALDSAFVRANAAESVRTRLPLSQRWQLAPDERERAEQAELASYDVPPEQWGARLALMSAFESLHAALRLASSRSAPRNPRASACREAAARAAEAARLACEAERVLASVPQTAPPPDSAPDAPPPPDSAYATLF